MLTVSKYLMDANDGEELFGVAFGIMGWNYERENLGCITAKTPGSDIYLVCSTHSFCTDLSSPALSMDTVTMV